MKRSLIGFAIALVVAAGCGTNDRDLPTIRTEIPFREDGTLSFMAPSGDTLTTIAIEVADTRAARHTGMMGRRGLPPQSGMLFIMDDVDTTGFWMKNTPLPLDIMFVGPDSQIINIAKRTTPYSERSIYPDAPMKFVVEVRGGFADRMGVTDSARISWVRTEDPPS